MLIDNILKKINLEDGSRGYYKFETFILNLLKAHLEKTNKPFIFQTSSIGFDGYAPQGLDDIDGGTQIEIKFNLERFPLKRLLNQTNNILRREASGPFENLLLITPNPISSGFREFIDSVPERENLPYKIRVWGPEEINKIVAKNRSEANEIANNLFSLRIESAVVQSSKDWEKERQKKLSCLVVYIKRDNFHSF